MLVRGACRAIFLAGVAAAMLAAPASTRQAQVVFLMKPPGAVQGGDVHAIVVVSRAVANCQGTLRHARTALTQSVPVVRLRASFSWRLPAGAAPGAWTIAVACGSAGSVSESLKVTKRAAPAGVPTVSVDKSGFGVAGTSVGYGVVLRNTAGDRDALGVTVTVNVLDAGNHVLKTEVTRLAGIPASQTYYFGGVIFLDAGTTAASLQASVRVAEGHAKRFKPPDLADLHAIDANGVAHVEGVLGNQGTRPISGLARITGVVFDAAGNVIGGGYTFPTGLVQPNDHVQFDLAVPGVTVDRIGSVQASVEPSVG